MIRATISGDVVASTKLSVPSRSVLETGVQELLQKLRADFNVYGRVIKGDYLECYLPNPADALRVALITKCFIKSLAVDGASGIKQFKTHGIRLAIGIGEISRFDETKGIIDGEAIYLSGRLISRQGDVSGTRKIIKSTLFMDATNKQLVEEFEPALALLDVLIAKGTARQCEVVYLKLLGDSEDDIAQKLNVSQSAINQHSTSAGWNAIEKAVDRFSYVINNL
jgi:DNA-binding NarL/FixJ family response regulator